jgi:hypothetical protein
MTGLEALQSVQYVNVKGERFAVANINITSHNSIPRYEWASFKRTAFIWFERDCAPLVSLRRMSQ